jgi:hypothetical protein
MSSTPLNSVASQRRIVVASFPRLIIYRLLPLTCVVLGLCLLVIGMSATIRTRVLAYDWVHIDGSPTPGGLVLFSVGFFIFLRLLPVQALEIVGARFLVRNLRSRRTIDLGAAVELSWISAPFLQTLPTAALTLINASGESEEIRFVPNSVDLFNVLSQRIDNCNKDNLA